MFPFPSPSSLPPKNVPQARDGDLVVSLSTSPLPPPPSATPLAGATAASDPGPSSSSSSFSSTDPSQHLRRPRKIVTFPSPTATASHLGSSSLSMNSSSQQQQRQRTLIDRLEATHRRAETLQAWSWTEERRLGLERRWLAKVRLCRFPPSLSPLPRRPPFCFLSLSLSFPLGIAVCFWRACHLLPSVHRRCLSRLLS